MSNETVVATAHSGPCMASPSAPSLLAERAQADPDRVALMLDSGHRLAFGDWDRRTSAAAAGLAAHGLRRGDRVGLRFGSDEWLEFAVAYVAVLRCGGVAVPLSLRLATEETAAILADCAPTAIVHGTDTPPWRGWSAQLGELEDAGQGRDAPIGAHHDDLAQIIYTSGTTGVRKGVGATHANLAAGLRRRGPRRPMAHSDLLLHAFPIGTNAAQTMLLGTLVAHPTTLIVRVFEADWFCRLIEAHRVGSVFVVPAMANDLVRTGALEDHDLDSVVLVGSTAAPLTPTTAAALSRAMPTATIVDTYTTTEAWPAQTIMVFDPARPSSVGRPSDCEVMITDSEGVELRAGATGAVWLRTDAPSRVYFGDSTASVQVFRNGWVRTGDLGYLDSDGYLHLVDRESDIINCGGHNVSTLQVERALLEHEHITDAAAFAVAHPVVGTQVAAAVVTNSPLEVTALRRFLSHSLAPYETPAHIRYLKTLPRNEGGKVLKRQLARELELSLAEAADQTEPIPQPASPTENLLRDLWQRVLGVPRLGPQPDFFALGGDSLRAIQLAEAVTAAVGVELPPSFALATPLLADQVAIVEAEAARPKLPEVSEGSVGDETASLALWPMQEYYRRHLGRYDIPPVAIVVRLRETVDVAALEDTLDVVISRHEALRTVFDTSGSPQVVDEVRFRLAVKSVEGLPEQAREAAARTLVQAEVKRSFDLVGVPLVRALLVRMSARDAVLALTIHHVIGDGASADILLREISLVYSAVRDGRPSPLPADGPPSIALAAREARDDHSRSREYWDRRLAGLAADPHSGQKATIHSFDRGEHQVTLTATTAARLLAVARQEAATVFVAVTTAWAAVVGDYLHTDDVVLATPVAGRTRPERRNVVGCLARDLLLPIEVGGDPTFRELLARVRRETATALDHQHYPYADYAWRVPHAQLNVEEMQHPLRIPGLASERFDLGYIPVAEWDRCNNGFSIPALIVRSFETEWTGTLVFNRAAVAPATMGHLAEQFVCVMTMAAEGPDQRLSKLLATRIGH
jgi:acyl-CoA synthetase (AMP-forming)/AMP-acid ligase II